MKHATKPILLVVLSCMTLLLFGCGEQTFEEQYKAYMEDIGNDVTGLQVFDKIERDGHGLAVVGRVVDNKLVSAPSLKPYTITSDGYEFGIGSGCGKTGMLGTDLGSAYCGPLGKRGQNATQVMLGQSEAKIIEIQGQRYWYGIADKDSLTVTYLNDAGNTIHQFDAGFSK